MGFSIELPDSGGVTRMGYKAADGGVAGVSSDIMDGDLVVDLKKKKIQALRTSGREREEYMRPAVRRNPNSISCKSTTTPDRAINRP